MLHKVIILTLWLLLAVGCANKNYHAPFINQDETLNLEFGMTQNWILKELGDPLYVAYGDKDKIIWVYEVRTREVQSYVVPFNKTVIPLKVANKPIGVRHASPIHKISLTFIKGILSSWEIVDE